MSNTYIWTKISELSSVINRREVAGSYFCRSFGNSSLPLIIYISSIRTSIVTATMVLAWVIPFQILLHSEKFLDIDHGLLSSHATLISKLARLTSACVRCQIHTWALVGKVPGYSSSIPPPYLRSHTNTSSQRNMLIEVFHPTGISSAREFRMLFILFRISALLRVCNARR